ncbi:phosphopantothenoylcysteine synthetase/decarboxylase [Hamadaea flava]|uniref:Flavoprotein n=1 Tax=Hamadaea flava TaxID=1742688 RepID=A0ABV8LR42_9ACTN|nr:flavoprotein [Hamadaea flava]MCP2327247.1 phosphopantothenoylcysteine synthetase/decarboxylase [Hamadaea flava]
MTVLYVVTCGSPAARDVARLVTSAQEIGWQVCVVATPDGRKFIDVPAIAEQTGYAVRSTFKNPGEPDLLPAADAMIVAPATANTIAKWAAGIADTLALGLLCEGLGRGLPIVAVPFTNSGMAGHPAFVESLERLRGWGVTVLWGQDILPTFRPGEGDAHFEAMPWDLALSEIRKRLDVA